MHRALLVAGLLGSWAAGCANPTIAFDDLDASALRSRCERFVRCGVAADQESCEGFFRKRVDHDLAAAVRAGIVRYDAELARVCHDTLAAMSCDDTSREVRIPPQACARMFAGTLALDAACEFDRECTSNRCEPTAPPCGIGECCPGTCVERVLSATDETCATSQDCATDLYCGQDLLCHPLGAEDDQCFVDAQCDYGLACDTATFPGSCVTPGQQGEPCPDDRCAEAGMSCRMNACGPVGFAGEPCTTNAECAAFDSYCDGARCIGYPEIGMSCVDAPCRSDAWCDLDSVPPVCREPRANSEPCKSNDQCATFHCEEGPAFDYCAPVVVCF